MAVSSSPILAAKLRECLECRRPADRLSAGGEHMPAITICRQRELASGRAPYRRASPRRTAGRLSAIKPTPRGPTRVPRDHEPVQAAPPKLPRRAVASLLARALIQHNSQWRPVNCVERLPQALGLGPIVECEASLVHQGDATDRSGDHHTQMVRQTQQFG